jgi:DNA-binding response OmpR family regulator
MQSVLDGVRVLCVDDNPDICELLMIALEYAGATVMTATSVKDALVVFKQFKPDLLISDARMPGESGYALIRHVRSLKAEHGGQIPAIAFTGYSTPDASSLALSEGYDEYVPKPVDPDELVAIIANLLKKRPSGIWEKELLERARRFVERMGYN